MRLQARFFAFFAAVSVLTLDAGTGLSAQSTASPTAGNGTYIAVDPLANVRYDNRFDASLGAAYGHIMAGPALLHGANLGGLDLSGSYWFSKHWAVEGSGRGYLGSSGAGTNSEGISIKGPFVAQYMFVAGPQWLGPHNKHGALIAHVLAGGAYGEFQKDLLGYSPSLFDFYNNQIAPAAVFGGHIDLNRSPQWVFRITPDALYTRYSTNYATPTTASGGHNNWNFGLSAGVEYKFKKKR
jgi:hypothetical protein